MKSLPRFYYDPLFAMQKPTTELTNGLKDTAAHLAHEHGPVLISHNQA
jgi:hypothetical protein